MPALEFGILGPVQIRCADSSVPVTRPRELALLAALLVSYGKVVSVGDLAQALWGEQPPSTGRRQVAICISRLRQAFAAADGPADAIATSNPGYVISAGRLDAVHFEELATWARAARAAGQPQRAAELFRTGLRLWRGPALHGIERPFASIEAARLEERRATATEELIDCELELGRHADLIGELLALVAADPLRERPRGQLMLALYRSGRAAEALGVYRDGRQLLVESLGVEPGPELQQLHQAILRHDTTVFPPRIPLPRVDRSASPPPGSAPPAQLPPDIAAFTGRDAELNLIDDLAARSDGSLPIAVISGVAGAGKTGLAVHWSHRALRRFPDGQLFADLRGYDPHNEPLSAATVLDQFLRALGVPGHQIPAELTGRTAQFRTLLSGRRFLVVLDNARAIDQIYPLLPGSGTCFVLVTSRDRLDGLVALHGAKTFRLGPLSLGEAGVLLARTADAQASRTTTDQIAELCDRLPLAIRIAAARLAAHPDASTAPDVAAGALIERLAGEQRRLTELSVGDTAVRVSLGLSYRELPGQAAELFRRLGLVDARDFATWIAATLMDTDQQSAAELLDQLVRAGLLEPACTDCAGQARYRLHNLIRLFAREQAYAADSETTRREAIARVFAAALYLAQTADTALGNPFVVPFYGQSPRYEPAGATPHADPLAWLNAERAVLTSAVAQAARLGFAGYAWELTSALCQFLSTSRYLADWEDCAERAIAAARASGDERGEAAALLQLADRYGDPGRFRDAARLLTRATRLLRRSADAHALAIGLTTRALVLLARNGAVRAQHDAQQALALLESGGSAVEPARCRALTALGISYLEQGEYTAATECFDHVLMSQRRSRSIRGQAEARYRLGTARLLQGNYLEASHHLADAMHAASQADDLMTAMIAQIRLGQAYVQLGALDQAQPLLEEAVDRVSAAQSVKFRAVALRTLARLYQMRDQPAQARPLLIEAELLANGEGHGKPSTQTGLLPKPAVRAPLKLGS